MSENRYAVDGCIWVCGACGRTGTDRYEMGDTSCMTWAVLCFEEQVDGQWIAATPAGQFYRDSNPQPDKAEKP